MTYLNIYTAVKNLRFNLNILATDGGIKDWIRAREGEVWQHANWPLKGSVDPTVTVTAGSAVIPLPTGYAWAAQMLQLFDENGSELDYVAPDAFYRLYEPWKVPTVQRSRGEAWTITGSLAAGVLTPQLLVAPTPDATRTYTIRGWNLPICRSGAAAWKAGTMSADTDLPWWPDDYHYFLVSGAIALGKRQLSDPSWQADEQDFQSGLERLAAELLPVARAKAQVWGAPQG